MTNAYRTINIECITIIATRCLINVMFIDANRSSKISRNNRPIRRFAGNNIECGILNIAGIDQGNSAIDAIPREKTAAQS